MEVLNRGAARCRGTDVQRCRYGGAGVRGGAEVLGDEEVLKRC